MKNNDILEELFLNRTEKIMRYYFINDCRAIYKIWTETEVAVEHIQQILRFGSDSDLIYEMIQLAVISS